MRASGYPEVSGLYNATIVCSFFSLFSQGQSSLQFRKISTFPLQLMSDNNNYAAAGLVETAKNEEKPNRHLDQLISLAKQENRKTKKSYIAQWELDEQDFHDALKDKPQVAHLIVQSFESVRRMSPEQFQYILALNFAVFEAASLDEKGEKLQGDLLRCKNADYVAASKFVRSLPNHVKTVQVATKISLTKPLKSTRSSTHFAYGNANFVEIRFYKMFYVDHSNFIEKIEAKGPFVCCFKPPRWGKSLFLGMLRVYYDSKVSVEEFNLLFSGLYIHKHLTSNARCYEILDIDLSPSSAESTESIKVSLYAKLNNSITYFKAKYYYPDVTINKNDALESLKNLANAVQARGSSLYILIDEYDRYANQLLFTQNTVDYSDMVRGKSQMPQSSVLRSILVGLKQIQSSFPGLRVYMTGVAPLALVDASGVNMFANISLESQFAGMLGFDEKDIRAGCEFLVASQKLATDQVEPLLGVLKKYYNGYKFFPDSEAPSLFNPTFSIYLLSKIYEQPEIVNRLIRSSNPGDFCTFEDVNVRVSEGFFDLISKNEQSDPIIAMLMSGSPVQHDSGVNAGLKLYDILSDLKQFSTRDLISLLFYHGAVTYGHCESNNVNYVIPNIFIKELFYDRLRERLKQFCGDTLHFLLTEDSKFLQNGLRQLSKDFKFSTQFDTEASLKARLLVAFKSSVTRISIDITSEYSPSESWERVDVAVMRKEIANVTSKQFFFELKSVPLNWFQEGRGTSIDASNFATKISEYNMEKCKALVFTHFVNNKMIVKKVEDYVQDGKDQLKRYLKIQKKSSPSQETVGYLVWSVGVELIFVERVDL